MAINKVKVSAQPQVGDINDFEVLGVDKSTGMSAKADMVQLRGNVGPKGDTGAKGERGDRGAVGPQGPVGATGPQGPQGEPFEYSDFTAAQLAALKGEKGDTGDTGATGPQGVKGDTGATGPVGPQGERGEKGDKGEGLDYTTMTPEEIAGITGKSAYDVAVEQGFSGTVAEWLASLEGAKGDKGDTGATGSKGPKGDTGATGPQGPKGDVGATGADGVSPTLSDALPAAPGTASAGTADTAARADHVHEIPNNLSCLMDNRSVQTQPNDYNSKFAAVGLKLNSAIDNPSGDTYSYVTGYRAWCDRSGGPAWEMAYNNSGIFARKGDTDTWEQWNKVATTEDIDNIRVGSRNYVLRSDEAHAAANGYCSGWPLAPDVPRNKMLRFDMLIEVTEPSNGVLLFNSGAPTAWQFRTAVGVHRIEFTDVVIPEDAPNINFWINGVATIKNLNLYDSDVQVDWSPAPEDLQKRLTAVTDIQVTSELPSDAANHPSVLYLIPE